MYRRFALVFLIVSITCCHVFSQRDTLVLDTDRLGFEDIQKNENLFDNQKIVSASKTLKEVSDLPFTILIVSKEEILKNGYTTLVDVLKMAPGIRISQPGSALEGETFLMRGLKGNTYTKILINGSPVKPFGVVGMPIGAQLPVRQAERIEIIYGPGAAIYGADANAGVINIIIEETQKPLNTVANLAIGTNGYTNVDVMFGGKLGKGKKIVHFNFYGSATNLDTRNNTFDKQVLFDPSIYSNTGNYLSNPNYVADSFEVAINALPHESQMIGFSLRYKMLKLKSQILSRKDHSALGLNPSAVSYANPLNYIGERIINSEISLGKTYRRFSFDTKLGVIDYYIDPQSNTDYVTNTLSEVADEVLKNIATDSISNVFDPVLYDSLSQFVYNRYFSGVRFNAGRSFESYLDQSFNVFLLKNWELTFGGRFNFSTAVSQLNYAPTPLYFEPTRTLLYDEQKVPFKPKRSEIQEASLYVQNYITFKKINFIGGLQYYYNSEYGRAFNPRYAIIYKPTPEIGIRAFYGEAFRSPTPFYNSNSYLVSSFNFQPIVQVNANYVPEETKSYELGIRWSPNKNIALDVNLFNTRTKNLIGSNFLRNPMNPDQLFFFFGYLNFGEAEVNLTGIQSNFVFQNLLPKKNLSINCNFTLSTGDEKEFARNFIKRDLKEAPNVIAKARIFYQPFDRWSITTDHIYMSAVNNGNDPVGTTINPYITRSFYTMDLLLRFELNRHFNIYLKFNNVFNEVYAGLNASNSPDDLIFNPQELRVYRLGMNYQL